jgi:hypothetical protein
MATAIIYENILYNYMAYISDEQFTHHVNKEKNDFHDWIETSIQDGELAKALKRVKTKKTLTSRIANRIQELEKATRQ